MNCLHPVDCWICGDKPCKSDGVISPNLVWSRTKARRYWSDAFDSMLVKPLYGKSKWIRYRMDRGYLQLSCGKCAACQIDKRKDMSVRLVHEASQHEDCCFVTLTYNDDNLPYVSTVRSSLVGDVECEVQECEFRRPTLCVADAQKFVKRLRRFLDYIPKKGIRDHAKIRYFLVGEYGSKTHRPHYHLLIFGWKPKDLVLHMVHNGKPVYRSATIEKLWTLGYSTLCDVSPFVAKYCARYVTKKFARLDGDVDETVVPEFVLQSKAGGAIGAKWFDRFGVDSCRQGVCTYRCGERIYKAKIPQYYWRRCRRIALSVWLDCRDLRVAWIRDHGKPSVDLDAVRRKVKVGKYSFFQEVSREIF